MALGNKLLLPWPSVSHRSGPDHNSLQHTILSRVLDVWLRSSVTRVVVVVDAHGEPQIEQLCKELNVDLVPAQNPADMKASIVCGLDFIQRRYAPAENAAWMVAPADIPALNPSVVEAVAHAARSTTNHVVVPQFAREGQEPKSGHPVALPWLVAARVAQLGPTAGLNTLIADWPHKTRLRFKSTDYAADIDTSHEYNQALRQIRDNMQPAPPPDDPSSS